MDLVSQVNESESRLQRERDTALSTVDEQKRKLNNLYVKIGRLWEENDALKEDVTALKDQEKKKEELCQTCKAKDIKIAQLDEQLYSAGSVRPKTDPDVDAAQAGLRIASFKAEEELRTRNLEHAAEMAKIQEEHGVIASRLHEEVHAARTAHELAQDQLRLLRQNKRKKTSLSPQRKPPPLLFAEEIPWLFCVSGAGGISYHTLHELSPDAQQEVGERFQYCFSASNDAQYDVAEAIHHNTYATVVSESNRLANVGKRCVQTIVVARGYGSRAPQQTGEYEACGLCQRKGCPCAKLIIHNGNPVLCWYGQGSGASSVTSWQDAAYWIR